MDDADSDAETHGNINFVLVDCIRHGHTYRMNGYGHAFCCLQIAKYIGKEKSEWN